MATTQMWMPPWLLCYARCDLHHEQPSRYDNPTENITRNLCPTAFLSSGMRSFKPTSRCRRTRFSNREHRISGRSFTRSCPEHSVCWAAARKVVIGRRRAIHSEWGSQHTGTINPLPVCHTQRGSAGVGRSTKTTERECQRHYLPPGYAGSRLLWRKPERQKRSPLGHATSLGCVV